MPKPEIGKRIGLRSDSILVIQTWIRLNFRHVANLIKSDKDPDGGRGYKRDN